MLIWIPILPCTQPEQQLRRRVELAFRENRISDGLALLSAHKQEEFPPHWDPPPRFLKGDRMSNVLEIWEEILQREPSPWVRQRYLRKLKDYLKYERYGFNDERVARLLDRTPEAVELLAAMDQWRRERLEPYLRPELRRTKEPGSP